MHRTNSTGHAVMVSLLILMLAQGIRAQTGSREKGEKSGTTLRVVVASGRLEDLRWPDFPDYRAQVESLYQRLGYAAVWIRNGQPTPQALEMTSILQQADGKGLLAQDYDSSRWPGRLALLQTRHTPADEARFDVALTVCTMRYVSALRLGRINPRHFEFGRDISPKEMDLSTLVLRPLDCVMKFVSGLLAGKLPVDGNAGTIHTAIPSSGLFTQSGDVRYPALAQALPGE